MWLLLLEKTHSKVKALADMQTLLLTGGRRMNFLEKTLMFTVAVVFFLSSLMLSTPASLAFYKNLCLHERSFEARL